MPQSKEPFRDPSEPLFEARINELEKGEGVGEITEAKIGTGAVTEAKLAANAVVAAKIASNAVTAAKIEANAVEFAKAKRAVAPVASGTESLTAELGTNGVHRTAIAVYNAKAEASAKVKIKHNLQTEYVHVTAYKAAAKKAEEIIEPFVAASTGGYVKVKIISSEEIELTLGTTAPAGKAEFFYLVSG